MLWLSCAVKPKSKRSSAVLSAPINRFEKPGVDCFSGKIGSDDLQVRIRLASMMSTPNSLRFASPKTGEPGRIRGLMSSNLGSGTTAGNVKTSAMVPISDDAAKAGCCSNTKMPTTAAHRGLSLNAIAAPNSSADRAAAPSIREFGDTGHHQAVDGERCIDHAELALGVEQILQFAARGLYAR